jgi:hypothetical protein
VYQEAKDQFATQLQDFDDIKSKANIYLVVSSLFITLPLTSDRLLDRILEAPYLAPIYFFTGIGFLVLAIIAILWSLSVVKIKILRPEEVYEAVPKYSRGKLLKAMAKNYITNLMCNDQAKLRNQNYLRIAENCIKVGIFLLVTGTIMSLVV